MGRTWGELLALFALTLSSVAIIVPVLDYAVTWWKTLLWAH